MKKKQVLSTILVAVLTSSILLSGCAKSSDAGEVVTEEASSEEVATADAEATEESSDAGSGEKVKITYAQWGNET